MGKVRKLSDSERKAIVAMFPQLGVTETAAAPDAPSRPCNASGRPTGRAGRIPRKLTQARARRGQPETTAERLTELRGILRAALNDAPPQAVAGLSREYRATIEELDRLEGGNGGDPVDSALDSIAARIAAKMPAP